MILPTVGIMDQPDSPLCVAEDTQAATVQLQSMVMEIPVKSGSDPRGTPNTDGSGVRKGGVRGAESNTGVGSDGEHTEGMSMDASIRLRVDKHTGGP